MQRRALLLAAALLAACAGPLTSSPGDAGDVGLADGQDAGDTGPDAGQLADDAGDPGADAGGLGPDGGDAGTVDTGDAGIEAGSDAGADGGNEAGSDAGIDGGSDAGDACPVGMAQVPGLAVCIDRWEAALVEDLADGGVQPWSPYYNPGDLAVRAESSGARQPQGYISGTQSAAACARAGKRLCTLSEWLRACEGPAGRTYPYGTTYVSKACNEGRTPHPVVQFFGTDVGVWDSVHMNNPGINQQADTVADSGGYSACVTPEGVYDLVGNLHEWISDASFKGGFYVDAKLNGNGCLYRTTAHSFDYHDYSTGFRCCTAAH